MNFGKIDITATFYFRICETPGDKQNAGYMAVKLHHVKNPEALCDEVAEQQRQRVCRELGLQLGDVELISYDEYVEETGDEDV